MARVYLFSALHPGERVKIRFDNGKEVRGAFEGLERGEFKGARFSIDGMKDSLRLSSSELSTWVMVETME